MFFAVAFPVVLALIIPSLNGGGDAHLGNGQLLGSFYAGTMAVYGAAVTAYVNMPEGVLSDRDTGVLKRLRATPLTAPQLLVGRVVGALAVALVTAFGIAVVAFVAFRPSWPPGLPAAVLSLVVATVCFAVVGLAVVSFAKSAQAGVAMTLGTLLPLAFISDIFVVGAEFPAPIEALSWFFPLRHASAAVTSALHPELGGVGAGVGPPGRAAGLDGGRGARRRVAVPLAERRGRPGLPSGRAVGGAAPRSAGDPHRDAAPAEVVRGCRRTGRAGSCRTAGTGRRRRAGRRGSGTGRAR